jgi:hypothetical protein
LRFIPKGVEASQISETPTFYQNELAIRNADVTGGKPMVNPLVAFAKSIEKRYAIGRKRELLYF